MQGIDKKSREEKAKQLLNSYDKSYKKNAFQNYKNSPIKEKVFI